MVQGTGALALPRNSFDKPDFFTNSHDWDAKLLANSSITFDGLWNSVDMYCSEDIGLDTDDSLIWKTTMYKLLVPYQGESESLSTSKESTPLKEWEFSLSRELLPSPREKTHPNTTWAVRSQSIIHEYPSIVEISMREVPIKDRESVQGKSGLRRGNSPQSRDASFGRNDL